MANRSKDIEATMIQLEILRCIPKLPYKITAKEVHERLLELGYERDKRSTERNLKTLLEHFEIECDDRTKPFGYSWKERARGLDLPILTEQQSLVLSLAEQQLKNMLPSSVLSSMKPFFEQANRMVYGAMGKPEYEWLGKVQSVPSSQPLIPAKIKDDIFATVSTALFKNRYLNIEYQNQQGKKQHARVMPLGLVQQGASSYLVVRWEDFENEILLAFHRIKKAELSFEFKRPANFNLKKYIAQGHLGFGADPHPIRLTFSISRSAGFHLTETPLSKDQIILEETEEFYRFQATVADNDMLEWWLRKFGEDIWDITKEKIE